MHLTTTAQPAAPALLIADLRAHCRTASSEDSYLELCIAAATQWVEAWLRRALIRRTYVYKVDGFPGQAWWSDPPCWYCGGEILLPYAPLASVTSVTYLDGNGDSQTLSSSTAYEVDTGSTPGRVRLRYGQAWPQTLCHPLSVTITYVAGYGLSDADVPEAIKAGLRLLAAHLYENREATSPLDVKTVPYGVEALLSSWRDFTVFG